MTLKVRDIDKTLRAITGFKVRDTGGVLRTIQTGKVRDTGGTLRTFWSGMAVTINPDVDFAQTVGTFTFPITIESGDYTAVVTGGTPPYSYSWVQVTGSGISGSAPNGATCSFYHLFNGAGAVSATIGVVVTDATGAQVTGPVGGPRPTVAISLHAVDYN